jgi:hypothetical protein
MSIKPRIYTITTLRANSERWLIACCYIDNMQTRWFYVSAKRSVREVSTPPPQSGWLNFRKVNWFSIAAKARVIIRSKMSETDFDDPVEPIIPISEPYPGLARNLRVCKRG